MQDHSPTPKSFRPGTWNSADTGQGRANRTTEQQSNVPVVLCSQKPPLFGCFWERENVGFYLLKRGHKCYNLIFPYSWVPILIRTRSFHCKNEILKHRFHENTCLSILKQPLLSRHVYNKNIQLNLHKIKGIAECLWPLGNKATWDMDRMIHEWTPEVDF